MVFLGGLDSATASATTLDASTSITANPGTFRIGGTVGSTFKSFRWASQSFSSADASTVVIVITVPLSPAMPDANYNVFMTVHIVNNFLWSALVDNKTTTSFDMRIFKRGASGGGTGTVDWVVVDF
jgi:hypothetical protein